MASSLATNVHLRTARVDDAAAICEVIRQSIRACCASDHHHDAQLVNQWLANKTTENVSAWITALNANAVVAEKDHQIVGIALLSDAVLALCYVLPQALHKAIGKAMLQHIEAVAMAAGHTHIDLTSTKTAQAFYLRNGFTLSGPAQYWQGLASQPMRKALARQSALPT